MSEVSLGEALHLARGHMADAAQKVYDEWQQNEHGWDEELGYGGPCQQISDAMSEVITVNIENVEVMPGGHEGDEHSFYIYYIDHEAWGVGIPYDIYEIRHGLYVWEKLPGVVFEPNDIQIFPVDLETEEDWQ